MLGHLNASVSNKKLGNESLPMAHASHPFAEIYTHISGQLAMANKTLNQTIYSSLIEIPVLAKNMTTEDYTNKVNSLDDIVRQSYNTVVPDNNRNIIILI
jgi:hypothetical protein